MGREGAEGGKRGKAWGEGLIGRLPMDPEAVNAGVLRVTPVA